MRLGELFKSWSMSGSTLIAELFGGLKLNGSLIQGSGAQQGGPITALVQAATVAINAALGNDFLLPLTTNVAFILGNPTNPPTAPGSEIIRITISNVSGGAHGAGTFDTLYKVSANVPAIADTKNRTLEFRWNGTNWVEMWRTAADVAN